MAGVRAAIQLPDRVTVLTCIGCGAMGRQEGCADCAAHKLVLVAAADYDALPAVADAARVRAARLEPVVRRLAEAPVAPDDPRAALEQLREAARRALRDAGRHADPVVPDTVTGWWCDRCGNVDLPQPCLGVCVWRPQQWVGAGRFDDRLALAEPVLHAARSLDRFLARVAATTPKAGAWQRNWEALRAQAQSLIGAAPGRSS